MIFDVIALLISLAVLNLCLGLAGMILDQRSEKEEKKAEDDFKTPKFRKVVDYWNGETEA